VPYEQLFSRPSHVRGAMGFMAAADLEAVLAAAGGLRTACHFVLGSRDAWVPEQPLRRVIARALPGAGVETWEGGHLLHEVEPERAAAWVLKHLPEAAHRA
jgi:magnesium chelatase accessory protein